MEPIEELDRIQGYIPAHVWVVVQGTKEKIQKQKNKRSRLQLLHGRQDGLQKSILSFSCSRQVQLTFENIIISGPENKGLLI